MARMYADEPDTETESAAERRQYTILLRYEEQQILFFTRSERWTKRHSLRINKLTLFNSK